MPLRRLLDMETFVVRVWKPDGDEHLRGMRGTAVHVSSGRSLTFTEETALIRFLVDPASAGEALAAVDSPPVTQSEVS